MLHVVHMLLFSGLISFHFAFLYGRRERRLRYGLTLGGVLGGAGLLLSYIAFPFS